MGILDKLKINRSKRFLVYLTAKGKKLRLGLIEAKNDDEFKKKLIETLENNEEAYKYSRIQIVDLNSGETLSIKNPFYEESEEDQPQRSRGSSSPAINITETINQALALQAQIYDKIITNAINTFMTYTEKLSVLRVNPTENKVSQLRDIANLAQALAVLITNYDKVEKVMKNLSPEILNKLGGGGKSQ